MWKVVHLWTTPEVTNLYVWAETNLLFNNHVAVSYTHLLEYFYVITFYITTFFYSLHLLLINVNKLNTAIKLIICNFWILTYQIFLRRFPVVLSYKKVVAYEVPRILFFWTTFYDNSLSLSLSLLSLIHISRRPLWVASFLTNHGVPEGKLRGFGSGRSTAYVCWWPTGEATKRVPVSYTHLDVYKRQL